MRDVGKPLIIDKGAIVWENQSICWLGPTEDLPKDYESVIFEDGRNSILIPGLIDCHTHLAFAGDRKDEFLMRLQGISYQDIAKKGGGIQKTVLETKKASKEFLKERCKETLKAMLANGVTSIEAKSGYGLDALNEMKILEVYRELNDEQAVFITPTYLGAHVLPVEYMGKRELYIEKLCSEWMSEVVSKSMAKYFDVFIEPIAFHVKEAEKMMEAARGHGLSIKAHAGQFSDNGAIELAVHHGATSIDHLECISREGLEALSKSKTVAVNLPLSSLYTHQPLLHIEPFLEKGVRLAIATDFNPGSSPCSSLYQAMWVSCVQQKMLPIQVLEAVTANAAIAIGRDESVGTLVQGKKADLFLLELQDIESWMYEFPTCFKKRVWKNGEEVTVSG